MIHQDSLCEYLVVANQLDLPEEAFSSCDSQPNRKQSGRQADENVGHGQKYLALLKLIVSVETNG